MYTASILPPTHLSRDQTETNVGRKQLIFLIQYYYSALFFSNEDASQAVVCSYVIFSKLTALHM